jgi:biopolymer transport protein TolR
MGMALGGAGQKAEINVTPMIDIMLVLIITFMLIMPATSHGLKALVPQPPDPDHKEPAVTRDIVITVVGDGTVRLNQEPVEVAALGDRLARPLNSVAIDVVFIRGGPDLEFQQVAEVIDIARGAGLQRIALMRGG